MENLNREAILRMLSGKTGNSSSGGGGGDIDLAGYATSIWVTENFVSIDFFRELFRAFDSNSQEILPNDTTSVVASIKAMVGLWTEQYLTALGNQSGGGGGGGGASYLNDLLDVQLTTPLTDGQALVYNATLQKWVNGAAGVNMTTVWNALAGSTNEQINASHLSTALSGYVTTSAISDMATQTWVGQQGFATQTWVTSNFITIAYFDRLFRAYNGSTLVSHNDTTTTIDNIKAMFGFWTDFYLSALGTGGVSSVSISLSQLADVNVAGVTNGQVLVYDATSNKWVNGTIQTGVSTLSSLTDVLLTSPTANQVLIWDATSSKWVNTSLKTINYQSIIGNGDISVGGGASGNYLPLTGGTLYGSNAELLRVSTSVSESYITFYANGQYVAAIGSAENKAIFGGGAVANYTYVSIDHSSRLALEFWTGSGRDTRLIHYDGISGAYFTGDTTFVNIKNNRCCILPHNAEIPGIIISDINKNYLGEIAWYNDHFFIGNYLNGIENSTISFFNNGHIRANGNFGVGGDPLYKFHVYGSNKMQKDLGYTLSNFINGQHNGVFEVGRESNSMCLTLGVTDDDYGYIQCKGANIISGGTLVINPQGGYVGIGTAPSYNFTVAGSIYATGAVTALSDIRHKTIIRDAAVSVEDIARMPAVMYQWNDGREDKGLHVGSIAQNWQTILPEVVLKANDEEGTLSMQYGVAALVSSIIIARKVVNHEDRIKQLEKENKELKERLNIA